MCGLALAFLLFWPFGGGTKVTLSAASNVPGASATANIGQDHNGNTTVDLQVKFLPPASSLTPAEATYVVWIQANGHPAQNKGALKVNSSHQASTKFRTPYQDFELFITAEPSALTTAPKGEHVIFGRITRPS